MRAINQRKNRACRHVRKFVCLFVCSQVCLSLCECLFVCVCLEACRALSGDLLVSFDALLIDLSASALPSSAVLLLLLLVLLILILILSLTKKLHAETAAKNRLNFLTLLRCDKSENKSQSSNLLPID